MKIGGSIKYAYFGSEKKVITGLGDRLTYCSLELKRITEMVG